MLHPVGSLPPRVYWRRRVVLLAVILLVVLLTVITVHSLRTTDAPSAAGASTTTATHSAPAPSTSVAPSSSAVDKTTPASTPPPSSAAAIAACAPAQLKIAAATDKPTYKVGDQPVVAMQVTNTGAAPCTAALGDVQIEFQIYNGAARVWGSHDCKIDPTPDMETLPINTTVAKTLVWSGYSSQVGCGTRQRVGAGTYTLNAYLSGQQGTPAQFAITG